MSAAGVMRRMLHRAILLLSLLASLASGSCTMRPDRPTAAAHLAHDVFFTLKDNSPAQCQRLVRACEERLAPLPGIVFFAAGTRAPDLQRDVNDQAYDVSLHVYFVDRGAHDAYQTAPAHLQFIAENKDNWRTVRVFDSNLGR